MMPVPHPGLAQAAVGRGRRTFDAGVHHRPPPVETGAGFLDRIAPIGGEPVSYPAPKGIGHLSDPKGIAYLRDPTGTDHLLGPTGLSVSFPDPKEPAFLRP
jgi:hypothetical protein